MSSITAPIVAQQLPEDQSGRHIVIVDAENTAEIEQRIREAPPNLIIEPEILHYPLSPPPRDLRRAKVPGPGLMAAGASITLNVTGGGAPLGDATVYFYTRSVGGTTNVTAGKTNKNGAVRFIVPAGANPAAALVAPRATFWPMIARGAAALSAPIECPPLPTAGPIGWWHQVVGVQDYDLSRGDGIKVGVLDTGIGPHPCLVHAHRVGGFDDNNIDLTPAAAVDVDQHGTHVAGTIGGRPLTAGENAGIAPGCARVFPAGGLSSSAAIANAIDEMADNQRVDLINMSLGAPQPSETIHDAIKSAAQKGVLCIVAAGNSAGAVNCPGAFKEVVAVSALGLEGWAPPGRVSASRLPEDPDLFGEDGLFLANFSCFGNEIQCCAPGVGVIAPVPSPAKSSLFAGMDGTSMATPVACGVAAALLSQNAAYLAMPRDIGRTPAARQIIASASRNIGLDAIYQGRGIPTV